MKSSFPVLEKKVPESKKYAHIGSSIDTGASAKKEKLHSANVTAKRKDEIFKRIRPSTLVRLLQEREVSESVYAMGPGSERGDAASSVIASKGPGNPVAPSMASVTSVAGCGNPREDDSPREIVAMCELVFEKSMLRHALSKHVHRSDYRETAKRRLRLERHVSQRRQATVEAKGCSADDQVLEEELSPTTKSRRSRYGIALPEWLQVARSPQRTAEAEHKCKSGTCERWLKNANRYVERSEELRTVEGDPQSARTRPLTVTFHGSDPVKDAWLRWDFLQHMPEYISHLLDDAVESQSQRSQLDVRQWSALWKRTRRSRRREIWFYWM
eukprot:symbB.v1.2.038834.t1/scaffold6197.1/size20160/2